MIANDYRNAVVDQTNVVYDMILLEEDSQDILDTYDGTGFLLDTEERKDNHTWNGFYLKSKPFVLPEVGGVRTGSVSWFWKILRIRPIMCMHGIFQFQKSDS